MTILQVHNFALQKGGADEVMVAEANLLRAHGHRVERYTLDNATISDSGRARSAARAFWNRDAYRAIRDRASAERADVVHFHTTFPLISPAGYVAARDAGARVVQTLHDFRIVCPNALLFRDGAPCESCVGRSVAWPGVVHRCYKGSAVASGVAAAVHTAHSIRGTFQHDVDVYLVPTAFARERFVRGGLPADRVIVKPNFVTVDTEPGTGAGGYALFVGRLVPEKGLGVMLGAWQRINEEAGRAPLELKIVGDGPMREEIAARASGMADVELLGRHPLEEVHRLMANARLLVFPSTWYETFGLVAAEAFACGTPVIASAHGAMAELVDDGRTGLLFRPNDPIDLARAVHWALDHPNEWSAMRTEARREYERLYTPKIGYESLRRAYGRAEPVTDIENHPRASAPAVAMR